MLFFYVRHGDPIYDPNKLTPLGHRQAEAVGKRLALYGVDKIYASSSNRAMQTADPTCEILKKEKEILDFCNEDHAWADFALDLPDGRKTWSFYHPEVRRLFVDPSVAALGLKWYEHPELAKYNFKKGIDRIQTELDALLLKHGYEHIPGTGTYKAVRPNDDRIALFAHQGFGMNFMSQLLDIPYPFYATHFDMTHTGMTAIEFKDEGDGIVIPKVLTLSSDAHIYKEGLPMNYCNYIRF